jgi:glycosyltransferase involved in cell wall biosynthesis
MRIAHVFRKLNEFGGAEEHLTTLAVLQKANGDEVSVYLSSAAERDNQYLQRLQAAGVRVVQWPRWFSRATTRWETTEWILAAVVKVLAPATAVAAVVVGAASKRPARLARLSVEGRIRTVCGRLLRREEDTFRLLLSADRLWARPQVYHLHSYGGSLDFVASWGTEHHVPTVYQEHSTPDETPRPYYRLPSNLNEASLVIAVSRASASAVKRLCGLSREPKVIPPFAEPGPEPSEAPSGRRARRVRVVTVARLSPEKGLDDLVRAAQMVVAAGDDVTFSVFGDGPMRDRLRRQIDEAGLSGRVELRGAFTREELPQILRDADVFVLPSRTEGCPLSVVEALCAGIPVVATAVGGIPELVQERVTGMLTAPADAAALATAITAIVRDPEARSAMGTAARRFYAESLRPSALLPLVAGAYDEAIAVVETGRTR